VDHQTFYKARPEDSRKGDFGRVVIAGGSERYAGAPAFNALAALRAGADLAIVVAPRRAADLVAGYAPDLITVPCDAPFPEPRVVVDIAKDALIVGGGIQRSALAHEAIRAIVRECDKPMVLDAEALHAIAGKPEMLRGKTALLTPHAGEFEVLAGKAWPSDEPSRRAAARALAERYHATVVVKGRFEVVSDGAREHVDVEGSSFLTKGGYGDLTAGVAGAMLARGHSSFDASVLATWLVGRAGKLAADALGESTLASDALARFSEALCSKE